MKIKSKYSIQSLDASTNAQKTDTNKTADEIIQNIRQRYGIANSRRSTETIESFIQDSIGSSHNIAKPDYNGEFILRDYAKSNVQVSKERVLLDGFTQTSIMMEDIGSQVQFEQISTGTQAQLLIPTSSKSTNASVEQNLKETQTTKDVVFLQDLEEIVSFMDDVVSQVNCQKETRQVQTLNQELVSQSCQTQRDCVELGLQTCTAITKSSESQTKDKILSDQGIQNVSSLTNASQQTQVFRHDVGTFMEFSDSESDSSEITEFQESKEEEIFKQDLILNLLQEKLQEYKLRLKSLE